MGEIDFNLKITYIYIYVKLCEKIKNLITREPNLNEMEGINGEILFVEEAFDMKKN